MKNTLIKHIAPLLIICCTIISINSCEQEDVDMYYNCDDCYSEYPDSSTILVYLTINEENPEVLLRYYRGDIENEIIEYTDTARNDTVGLSGCAIGEEYSVKAYYKVNNEIVIAVDSDEMTVIDAEYDCGSPCYIVQGGTLNVKLKTE